MLKRLAYVADQLDVAGLLDEADILDDFIVREAAKRNRPAAILNSDHPKVRDGMDHFPILNLSQARNALARVNQFETKPLWWRGTLSELVNTVIKAVKKKYPSVRISDAAKRPGKN
jgi:hypothetical protein